ncbi:apolipoprotein A1/A4/E family protein [Borrelia turicatae]|uniref:apolipoprotein A1/A4/E family protein n=1 Tax=Borrelia turicatae TaxID=142 RepID=UPI001FF3177D|nr:apolipoprotein A1/A4/E family protein [Borrelia turicatae]
MGLAQPVVTQQMVIAELTKAGINRDIAVDLSYRYYKNELTYKDIEFLKENFDIKLKHLEDGIINVKDELNTKIDSVENNLNIKIDTKFNELDKKIDTVENNFNLKLEKVEALLQAEIQSVETTLKSDIRDLDTKIDTVRSELKSDIKDLDNKIDVNKMELRSTLRLHGWMFGTLITLNIGIFLTLMSIVYSLLSK